MGEGKRGGDKGGVIRVRGIRTLCLYKVLIMSETILGMKWTMSERSWILCLGNRVGNVRVLWHVRGIWCKTLIYVSLQLYIDK